MQNIQTELLFSGVLVKAGDDNDRWKHRYFQLIAKREASLKTNYILRYFENDRDAFKGKPPRGEISVFDILGISVLANKYITDPNMQVLAELTCDHVHEGPAKLMIFGRDRFWRLAEVGMHTSVIGELIRALDRILTHHIARISIRMVGWIRAQGSISWNRRYAILFSNGQLLSFLNETLDILRRRIELDKAQEIRPKQPLASSGSLSEKRILRLLNASIDSSAAPPTSSLQPMWSVDMSDLLGIRLLHPLIQEKNGYIMCVERMSPNEDASILYARFRKWIVQLQLSFSESRFTGFTPKDERGGGGGAPMMSDDEDGILERKLIQICTSALQAPAASTLLPLPQQHASVQELNRSVAWEYLLRFGAFPLLWRSNLWLVLSGGLHLKRTMNTSYANLVIKEEGQDPDECTRVQNALSKVDSNMPIVPLLLEHGGEDNAFWTVLGFAPKERALLSNQGGFALFVEAKVVIDLLAMKHASLLAHLSSYDLTKALIRSLTCTLLARWGASLAEVWDAACVVGARESLSFCAVHLLSLKRSEMLDCYTEDELTQVILRRYKDDVIFPWKELDVHISQRLRKAQWAAIVSTMREHSNRLRSWRLCALEAKELARRLIAQCNRLDQNSDDDFERVHWLAVRVYSTASDVCLRSDVAERNLEHNMLRIVGGGGNNDEPSTVMREEESASLLLPLMDTLNADLTSLALMCVALGWKAWNVANQRSYRDHCQFIPRAGISSTLVDAAVVAATTSTATTSAVNSANTNSNTTTADSSSIKIIANVIRRRLFTSQQQQHQQQQQQQPQTSPADSLAEEKIPLAPHLGATPPLALLDKFRGGFIGLVEIAGCALDAEFAKVGQLQDSTLLHLLDVLDVMLKTASFSTTLQRWLSRSWKIVNVVPEEMPLRHLFLVGGAIQFDKNRLKTLEEALTEIYQRTCGSSGGSDT